MSRRPASKPKPTFSWDAVDVLQPSAPEAPPNGFTTADYAARYNLPPATAQNRLEKLAREGKLETARVGGRDTNGRRCMIRVYWVPKK